MNQKRGRAISRGALICSAAVASACGGGGSDEAPPPPTTLQQVTSFLASYDALWASSVPNSGAKRLSLTDDCYRDSGGTKAYFIANTDANLAEIVERDAYRVGETRTNIKVLAERDITNADGSKRKEVDVQYDVNYKDGSIAPANPVTLISGSSAGTPGCSTPQNSSSLRFLGNQQLVNVIVRPRNQRDERYSIANGAALSVNYRRDVQFIVVDPMDNATYAIVSGPGPAPAGAGGEPFSLKLISPRLLRSAPELAGKVGNFLNWLDDDSFRACRISGGVAPVASVADCAGQGATGANWGWTTPTPDAADDAGFQGQGWVEGGTYTFAVYKDDGWKTINGQAGKTPIATYTAKLKKLPYTFVEMAGTGVNADKFPRISFGGLTSAQVQANVVGTTSTAMNLSWNAPAALSDARQWRLLSGWEFFQGPKTGNAAGVFYPGYRVLEEGYPGPTATSVNGVQATPKLSDMGSKSYEEFVLQYTDRDDSRILSLVTFN